MIALFILICVLSNIGVAVVAYSVGWEISYKETRRISNVFVSELSATMKTHGIEPPPNPFKDEP